MRMFRFSLLTALVLTLALPFEVSAQLPAAPVAPASQGVDVTVVETLKKELADKEIVIQSVKAQAEMAQRQTAETRRMLDEMATAQAALKADMAAKLAVTAEAEVEEMAGSVSDLITGLTNSTNMMWVLIAGFLVMFMQAGFAMVEAGFTRAKNCCHTVCMNLVDYCIAMLAFWAFGFAFMFGGSGGASSMGPEGETALSSMLTIGDWNILGTTGFFLYGSEMYAGSIFALFLFQMVFMDTAATIPTGTLAERWKFLPFCIMAFLIGAVIYPVFGCWVWGGGWLSQLGYTDFAGSSVVHLTGAMIGLAGAVVMGPRYGKFNKNGTPNPIPGHNIPMAFLGTFILAFGWFGFNAGSTLAANDSQIGIIATNTMLSSAAGAIVAMILTWSRFGKPDPSFMANGLLAGLVGITAPCAFVDAWAAVLIGAVAGFLVFVSVFFVEETMKLDDPVGAISVHGTCGIWGVLAVGIFGNGLYGDVTGLLFGGSIGFFGVQCLGILTCIVWVGVSSYVAFGILEAIMGNRSEAVDEISGLDIPETGALGYQADLNPESR